MAKDYARPFYDSQQWRTTREAYLHSQHYICEDCGGTASIVHHITYIKPWNVNDPDITLNWNNLKAVCEKCHAAEHARDMKSRGAAARLNGVAFDEDGNLIKQANVFLVCGSPASGKTTYVTEHKSRNDLVVDLDYICAALNGETGNVHLEHRPILSVALEVRELLYQIIQTRRGKWERAFVITTIADTREMKAIADELRAEIIIMDTTLAECIRRIRSDPSRRHNRTLNEKIAKEWFEKYENSLRGEEIPPVSIF
jgi:predicted kinase